jgi:AraC-like DNA-binding protein
LIAANTPLAQAAADAGFADQSHMTRVFTSRYGVSPGAYAAALCCRPKPAILFKTK